MASILHTLYSGGLLQLGGSESFVTGGLLAEVAEDMTLDFSDGRGSIIPAY
jgi:hypothetical protein